LEIAQALDADELSSTKEPAWTIAAVAASGSLFPLRRVPRVRHALVRSDVGDKIASGSSASFR